MSQKTFIDTFAITCVAQPSDVLDALRKVLPGLRTEQQDKGALGYDRQARIYLDTLLVGWLLWGGKSQRGTVYLCIDGKGCLRLNDWPAVVQVLSALPSARLNRVDIAMDTFRGEVTYDRVIQAKEGGKFNPERGRRPTFSFNRGENENGENAGRTLYVGKRQSSKYGRFYEKGFEQLKDADLSTLAQLGLAPGDVEVPEGSGPAGCLMRDWFRCEIEFKRCGGEKVLEWQMLTTPDIYFAGAFPFCAELLPDVDPVGLDRVKRDVATDLASLLAFHRNLTGKLWAAMSKYGANPEAIRAYFTDGMESSPRFEAAGTAEELAAFCEEFNRRYERRAKLLAA